MTPQDRERLGKIKKQNSLSSSRMCTPDQVSWLISQLEAAAKDSERLDRVLSDLGNMDRANKADYVLMMPPNRNSDNFCYYRAGEFCHAGETPRAAIDKAIAAQRKS